MLDLFLVIPLIILALGVFGLFYLCVYDASEKSHLKTISFIVFLIWAWCSIFYFSEKVTGL